MTSYLVDVLMDIWAVVWRVSVIVMISFTFALGIYKWYEIVIDWMNPKVDK